MVGPRWGLKFCLFFKLAPTWCWCSEYVVSKALKNANNEPTTCLLWFPIFICFVLLWQNTTGWLVYNEQVFIALQIMDPPKSLFPWEFQEPSLLYLSTDGREHVRKRMMGPRHAYHYLTFCINNTNPSMRSEPSWPWCLPLGSTSKHLYWIFYFQRSITFLAYELWRHIQTIVSSSLICLWHWVRELV